MPDSAPFPAWGTRVERATVQGHSCLLYADRPRATADFLLTARRWPGRELLVQGKRRLTAAEHEAAVARVARRLTGLGVRRGTRVVLLAFNSIEWVVAFWAVQALGAVAVLGNAWWTDQELIAALTPAEPELVITDRPVPWPSLRLAEVQALVDDVDDPVDHASLPA